MCLALRASGLWLRYATLQNLIPSFPWIAPHALHPGAIQGKEGIKFCHLATLNRKILTWIQRITETSPLLMVVGGYNFNATNGLISDVELVSATAGNACSKRVRPLPGTIR